eukprot:CAMPEP_0114343988 /NCGR_PEP_ID=MMETSP0101-20121206/11064_1 /TAXON_ID=38822 ORGANISM="Pteridomonas danica, Strain PT" /NCGR_SAMPLE_ID=MMETSP0101 /ASSEMBLY_ACC=CAM_ASM_000211 /LENGTH=86 /DNA_ID=CAMNT_0001479075 /DNA_START=1282 /DNA_END=1542 /DNA_ORIENTATION=+
MTPAAAVIPTDCIKNEKSRATIGDIPKTSVITGKATAAPPSDVAPASIDPNIIVIDIYHLGIPFAPALPLKRLKRSFVIIYDHQTV